MSSGSEMVALISITAGVVCISLGLYVYLKNPHLKISKIFFVSALVAFLVTIADLILITSPDEGTAQMVSHPLIFLSTLLAAMMLYLTAHLPYEQEQSWLIRRKRDFWLVVLFLASVPAVTIGTVAEDQYGWWISISLPVMWWYAVVYTFYLVGTASLIRLYLREESEDVRRYTMPPILATALPMVFAAVVTALGMSGTNVPPSLSMAILASSTLFAFAIIKQRLFLLRPVKEDGLERPTGPTMGPGRCVLMRSGPSDRAYELFVNELAASNQGLIITSSPPAEIRERYGLHNTPVVRLTPKPGPDSIDPSSLHLLTHTALQFLQKAPGSVILLDGLDLLRSFSSPEAVMQLLYNLRDASVVTGSKMIVTVDPERLGERELPKMERELEPIRA